MGIAEAWNMVTLQLRLKPTITGCEMHVFTDSEISLDYFFCKTSGKHMLKELVMSPIRELPHQALA